MPVSPPRPPCPSCRARAERKSQPPPPTCYDDCPKAIAAKNGVATDATEGWMEEEALRILERHR